MNLTSYSVNTYLLLLLVFGILDILLSVYLRAKNPRRVYPRKMLLRGCAWVILSLSFLDLFRRGILGIWTVFITVGILVLANEYLLIWIEKILSSKEIAQTPPTLQDTWSVIRGRGKNRFLLIGIAAYGAGLLWLAILIKIILLGAFPLYLVPISLVAGGLWGYFESAGEWKRNERQYRKLNDPSHDAA